MYELILVITVRPHRTFSGFRRLNNVPRFSYSWGLRLQRGHHAGKLGQEDIWQYCWDFNVECWLVDYLTTVRRCVQARLRPLWDLWAPLSNLMPSLTRGLQNPLFQIFALKGLEFQLPDWHLALTLIALGTLPTSTEQISMAGRSERFIVLLIFLRKNLLVHIRFVGTSCWFLGNSGILKQCDDDITSSCAFRKWPLLQYVFLQGMGDLCAMDLVPEPPIIASALRACRRVNDFSLTTRLVTSATWSYFVQNIYFVIGLLLN